MYRRMQRPDRSKPREAGKAAFNTFGHDNDFDIVVVAIDMEGYHGKPKDISGFGIAVFSGDSVDIPSANYGVDNSHRRKFLFSDSHNVDKSELPSSTASRKSNRSMSRRKSCLSGTA